MQFAQLIGGIDYIKRNKSDSYQGVEPFQITVRVQV